MPKRRDRSSQPHRARPHGAFPPGSHLRTPWYPVAASDVELLFDLTHVDAAGERVVEQEIFEAVFETVARADSFLVVDFFLFNAFAGDATAAHRALSGELTERLVEAKQRRPALPILFITDPINTVYGSEFHDGYETLARHGIDVVETDLEVLRDSNPGYSALYRRAFSWLGNRRGAGWLPNPFLPGDTVTLRSYLALLNFKANHRKVVVAGHLKEPPCAVVTSANPHDASSAHSNVGLRFLGSAATALLESELAIARFSGWQGELPAAVERAPLRGDYQLRVVTEGEIGPAILAAIDRTAEHDRVDLAMFYLAHRAIAEGLLRAAERGAEIRLVLDPNRDAFGHEKSGIPNRPLAAELRRRSRGRIAIRWYETHGEQFHAKLTACRHGGTLELCLGSANLTRRNLDDLNLEANVELRCPTQSALAHQVDEYFERLWTNRGGRFTVAYETFADESRLKHLRYRLAEASGLSTF